MSALTLLVVLILAAVLLRLATGSSFAELGSMQIQGEVPMVVVFVLVQTLPLAAGLFGQVRLVGLSIWLGLMMLLLVLCLINSRNSAGFRLISAGVASNVVVIGINGGMPVSATAVVTVGGEAGAVALAKGSLFHSTMSAATKLAVLGDVLPAAGFRGIRGVMSLGDVLTYVGLVVVVAAFRGSSARTRTPPVRDPG